MITLIMLFFVILEVDGNLNYVIFLLFYSFLVNCLYISILQLYSVSRGMDLITIFPLLSTILKTGFRID